MKEEEASRIRVRPKNSSHVMPISMSPVPVVTSKHKIANLVPELFIGVMLPNDKLSDAGPNGQTSQSPQLPAFG